MRDEHIDCVLVLGPPGIELHDLEVCKKMEVILQDKASCFPVFVMHHTLEALNMVAQQQPFDFFDACAAPGNKTTYLAAAVQQLGLFKSKIFAFDYTKSRFKTLVDRVKKAGAGQVVQCRNQDFLNVESNNPEFANVRAAIVDPSCSGSGIVSRHNCK